MSEAERFAAQIRQRTKNGWRLYCKATACHPEISPYQSKGASRVTTREICKEIKFVRDLGIVVDKNNFGCNWDI